MVHSRELGENRENVMAVPKQTDPQFKLRLTPEIKNRIEENAATNNRSLNAEMLDCLEKGLAHERLVTQIRRLEADVALSSSQSVELIQNVERRERELFTDLVKLRRLEPENEMLKETIRSKDELIQSLQESLSLARMMYEMQKLSIGLLTAILDEGEAGIYDLLKKTIANRKIELTDDDEAENESLILEMRRVAKMLSKNQRPSSP